MTRWRRIPREGGEREEQRRAALEKFDSEEERKRREEEFWRGTAGSEGRRRQLEERSLTTFINSRRDTPCT